MKEVARVYVRSLNYSIEAPGVRAITVVGEIADGGEGSLSGLMTLNSPLILCVDDEKADRAYRAILIDTIATLAKANALIDDIKRVVTQGVVSEEVEEIRYLIRTWELEKKGRA